MDSPRRRLRPSLPDVAQFQLELLDLLPCGCVVAVHRMQPSEVTLVSLEAKGPHCTNLRHRPNKVIRLGEPIDAMDYDEALPPPS